MQAIRSVLWIGDADGVPAAEITRTPWIDIVWEPDLLRALELRPGRFDDIVLDARDPDRALIGLMELRNVARNGAVVVLLDDVVDSVDALARAGARAVMQRSAAGLPERLLEVLRGGSGAQACAAVAQHPPDVPDTGLIGSSKAMAALRRQVRRFAGSQATVLITGETGTGKECVAQALHALGHRSAGPFVALNCAALPDTLLEAELLGHVRGAFTEARR